LDLSSATRSRIPISRMVHQETTMSLKNIDDPTKTIDNPSKDEKTMREVEIDKENKMMKNFPRWLGS